MEENETVVSEERVEDTSSNPPTDSPSEEGDVLVEGESVIEELPPVVDNTELIEKIDVLIENLEYLVDLCSLYLIYVVPVVFIASIMWAIFKHYLD